MIKYFKSPFSQRIIIFYIEEGKKSNSSKSLYVEGWKVLILLKTRHILSVFSKATKIFKEKLSKNENRPNQFEATNIKKNMEH
jgi:hypothetical protein